MKQGGTLISHGWSTNSLASEGGIGSVRRIQDTFEKSKDHDLVVQREWLASSEKLDVNGAMAHTVNVDNEYPWDTDATAYTKEELAKRDKWQSLFMPSGAMVSGRVDTEHWLSFGTPSTLPLLYANQPVLMTDGSADAVVRVGQLVKNYGNDEARALNWSTLPKGYDMQVRMSGLVWPEGITKNR